MLPSFAGTTDHVDYVVSNGDEIAMIHGGSANMFSENISSLPNWFYDNYTYDLGDDYIVLHYNNCRDADRMGQYLNEIEKVVGERGIKKCIVDLRNNLGGSDEPSYILCDWLHGRFDTLVALVNEWVYSSGMTTALMLSDLGAYTIGTSIGDSPCAFGNVVVKEFPEYGIAVRLSTKLMVAQPGKLRDKAYIKEEFVETFNSLADLPEIWYFQPDEYVERKVADAVLDRDPQMEAAIKFVNADK